MENLFCTPGGSDLSGTAAKLRVSGAPQTRVRTVWLDLRKGKGARELCRSTVGNSLVYGGTQDRKGVHKPFRIEGTRKEKNILRRLNRD